MTATAPIVHFEFRSSDFERTAAFYAKALGWQTQQNASSTYMKLDTGDGPSTGWVRADLSQAPGPLAYVEVDDLPARLVQIEKAGGRIIVPHRPFAGGGEVAIFADPDGNLVGLWARKKGATGATGAAASPAASAPTAKGEAGPATAAKPAKPAKAAPVVARPPKPAKPAKPAKR